ncbi:TipAS antibiotic-recognition domain-containing protein [Clostridium sp.]|uniref:TipAS antibiotic-recognition domain-containing protein n=1 Tax=Clostridium sp. TaxID=1506 RepID=UPI0026210C12|nr:TipAS antibiotic-recognition domain-containing protein [Clostridium sp.]
MWSLGLENREWNDALSEQKKYIKDKYGYNMPEVHDSQVSSMNEKAIEAQKFMGYIRDALKNGLKANDRNVQETLKNHIEFLNKHGHNIDAKAFAAQTRFFLDDDFHRNMLENQLIGLSYYLFVAADM